MLKSDLKEPCYTCQLSDIHFEEFSGESILYCNKMSVCKNVDAYERATDMEIVNELKHNADAEETMSSKQDNDPVNHPSHYTLLMNSLGIARAIF